MVGATTTATPYTARPIPSLFAGKLSRRIACSLGWSPPPPAPCRIRNTTSMPRLGASPHRNELNVNSATQSMSNRFRPSSEENHPLSGSTMAFETRYDVSTQVLSSTPAERLPAMCGRATLAILVSSISMKVASVTVTAMTHGLISPFSVRILASRRFMAVPIRGFCLRSRRLPRQNRCVHVHSQPEDRLFRRDGVKHDLHGDALHDLDEVA